jgi:hypothetical protein
MSLVKGFALGTVVLGLAAAPAFAVSPHPSPPANTSGPSGPQGASGSNQPGPNATPAAKAKAYGVYCQNQSKAHVAGQKGTPFSQCVTAMAKLATGATSSPKTACAALSKRHVAGQKGTPYSLCVAAGAKLLKDEHKP